MIVTILVPDVIFRTLVRPHIAVSPVVQTLGVVARGSAKVIIEVSVVTAFGTLKIDWSRTSHMHILNCCRLRHMPHLPFSPSSTHRTRCNRRCTIIPPVSVTVVISLASRYTHLVVYVSVVALLS